MDLPPLPDNLPESLPEGWDKVEELIKNVDTKDMPSRKMMMEMLDQSDLGDEMKESMKAMMNMGSPQFIGGYGQGTLLGVVFVIFIFGVLFFFGYKLYRSIKDKELKREEKKKVKQMKKKK